jgi:adenylate kinase
MLDELGCPLDAVVLIKIDDELVVTRLTNRRTCRACGKIFSLLDLTAVTGDTKNCPDCGGELYQRDDDSESVIRNRLQVYREQTEPLVEWYENKGLLHSFEVNEASYPEGTLKRIEVALGL